MHIPVLLNETLQYLEPRPGDNFIDCTVGEGGHALAILKMTAPNGKVLGIDRDAEMVERLRLPFPVLSDSTLAFAHALDLPLFEWDGKTLIKRLTLILRGGLIEHVFYPVFPPDKNAEIVIAWLTAHPI